MNDRATTNALARRIVGRARHEAVQARDRVRERLIQCLVSTSGDATTTAVEILATAEPTADLVLQAYTLGAYTLDEDGFEFEHPEQRGVSPLEGFHVPKHARRLIRKGELVTKVDTDFDEVMVRCAAPRPNDPTTWISDSDVIIVPFGF